MSQILQFILQAVPLLQAVANVFNAAVNLLVTIAKANAQFRVAGGY